MNNEQQLVDGGFILTPNVFNSGFGSGKVYAKSFDNVAPFTDVNVEGGFHYDYYSVDPNGVVAEFKPALNVVPTEEAPVVVDVIAPEVPVSEVVVAETPVVAEEVASPEEQAPAPEVSE